MGARAQNTTAKIWRERIVAQQHSGQSIRAWCRHAGCHENAFYAWRARLGLWPAGRSPRGRPHIAKPVAFAKLVVNPPTTDAGEPIRMSLAGGRELTLPASMPVEQIARLVRAIEGASPEPARSELVEPVEGTP